MNQAITLELQFFLISILWGVIIILAYDILRIFRRLITHKGLALAIEDILFWVLASFFIFAMIYRMNDGTIRGFSVMGMGIGMTLYHFIFSDLIVTWVTKALLLLLRPIKILLNRIKRMLRYALSKLRKTASKLYFQLKKAAKSVRIALNKKRAKHQAKRSKRLEARAAKRSEKRSKRAEARKARKKGKQSAGKDRKPDSDQAPAAEPKAVIAYRKPVVHRSGSIGKRRTAGRE